MYNLNTLRQKEFPLSAEYIYFNHASISPLPMRTQHKMQWVLTRLSEQPANFFMSDGMAIMESFQQELAALIHAARPQEIMPISSTSMGINMVAQAIPWQPGDNVVFCETEFPSNAYPWMSLERDGVEVRQATAVGGGLTLEALRPLVDERTRVVTASAIQFFCGHCTDLAAIGRFCRERDVLFFVDAIQAVGHMPIDVEAMHIDALACGGQKSLLAAPGIGFLYVRDAAAERMNPRIIGPNATQDWRHWMDYDLTFLPGAARFGTGTPNLAGMAGVVASVGLLRELGVAAIGEHTAELSRHAHDVLTARGYEVPTPRDRIGPIVTFASGRSDEATDALVAALGERHITVVKHLDAAGTPHVRLSFHCYNTVEEVDRFMDALAEIEREEAVSQPNPT